MNATQELPEVLDVSQLASLLGFSTNSIKNFRSRNPQALPMPFLRRPLRWRRDAVIEWMRKREQQEEMRIKQLFEPVSRPQRSSRGAVF